MGVKGQEHVVNPSSFVIACDMSLFHWLEKKGSSLLPLVGDEATSSVDKEVQKVEAQHHRKRGACYVCD